jgi:hypothetical protein
MRRYSVLHDAADNVRFTSHILFNCLVTYISASSCQKYTGTRATSQHDTRMEPKGSYTINDELGTNLVTDY